MDTLETVLQDALVDQIHHPLPLDYDHHAAARIVAGQHYTPGSEQHSEFSRAVAQRLNLLEVRKAAGIARLLMALDGTFRTPEQVAVTMGSDDFWRSFESASRDIAWERRISEKQHTSCERPMLRSRERTSRPRERRDGSRKHQTRGGTSDADGDPNPAPRLCKCGCGADLTGERPNKLWARGHQQRAAKGVQSPRPVDSPYELVFGLRYTDVFGPCGDEMGLRWLEDPEDERARLVARAKNGCQCGDRAILDPADGACLKCGQTAHWFRWLTFRDQALSLGAPSKLVARIGTGGGERYAAHAVGGVA